MPVASVIIPTYNRADLVMRTINSVLEQTLDDLEIVVVDDDGSTENTKALLSTCDDPRVNYFYKENGGVSSARNMGIDNASGDIVFFLDDDEQYDNHLSTVVEILKENPEEYGAIYCPWGEKDWPIDVLDTNKPSGAITTELFKKGIVHIIGCGIRRDILDGIRFDQALRIAEDSDFLLRVSLNAHFMFTTKTSAIHNITKVSLTSHFDESRALSLERFYFTLGGKSVVPKRTAMKKLSKSCRSVAKHYTKQEVYSAATWYFGKAIKYPPGDLRNYLPLLQTAVQAMWNPSTWEPPKALPEKISSE